MMAGNLLDLANRLQGLNSKIQDQANECKKAVALGIVQRLVEVTPVDTSKALSNWQITTNAPAVGDIQPYFPGIHGTTQRASAQQTVNEAQYQLGAVKPGQVVYITNNVDYIEKLEGGSSQQAPAGFVANALIVGRNIASKFKFKF